MLLRADRRRHRARPQGRKAAAHERDHRLSDANSQIKEIDKFISQSGLPEHLKPVVQRYTGQESQEQRKAIAANPPDISLTNFMMAELLLTRQDELDAKVIENAGTSNSWSLTSFIPTAAAKAPTWRSSSAVCATDAPATNR